MLAPLLVDAEETLLDRLRAGVARMADLAWAVLADAASHAIDPDPNAARAAAESHRALLSIEATCAELVREGLAAPDVTAADRGCLLAELATALDLVEIADVALRTAARSAALPGLPGALTDLAHAAVDELALAVVTLRRRRRQPLGTALTTSDRRERLEKGVEAVADHVRHEPELGAEVATLFRFLDAMASDAHRLGRAIAARSS